MRRRPFILRAPPMLKCRLASDSISDAKSLIAPFQPSNGFHARQVDASDLRALSELVESAEVVVR